jgi:hypothetical protein
MQFEFELASNFQVIIGTAAMHNLDATLKPSPLEKLEHACTLFQSAAKASSPASRALVSTLLIMIPGGHS